MGCLVSKNTFDSLQIELAAKKQKLAEYESQLIKSNPFEATSVEMHAEFCKDLELSFSNYRCLAKYFPLKDNVHAQISDKLSNFAYSKFTEQSYIFLKLQEKDIIKNMSNKFIKLMEKLKKIDLEMGKRIANKIISVGMIVTQEKYAKLAHKLKKIIEHQDQCNSFRGGSFEEIISRIERRCQLDRKLEVFQSKIENTQYKNILSVYVRDFKEVNSEIVELRQEKTDLEIDIVETRSGCNEEIDEVTEINKKLEEKINGLEDFINNFRKNENSLIEECNKIKEIEALTEIIQKEINGNVSLFESIECNLILMKLNKEEYNKSIQKISKFQKTKENLQIELDTLEEESKNNAVLKIKHEEAVQTSLNLDKTLDKLKLKSLELSDCLKNKKIEHRKTMKIYAILYLKKVIITTLSIPFYQ